MPKKKVDFYLLIPVVLLVLMGNIMVLSSSSVSSLEITKYNDPYYYFKRQLLWTIIGFITMYICYVIPYKVYKNKNGLFLGLIVGTLGLVLLPGVGHVQNGARSWFIIGQPSEMVKILLVLILASVMSNKIKKIDSFREGVLPPLILIGITCLLIFLQPDMGTAMVVALTGLVMLFAAGAELKYFVVTGISATALATFGVIFASYRLRRILIFLNPWKDPQGDGYQTIQSLYAIGSGGLSGQGLGQGRQKFLYIPEQHTDFIFSIIGEELGFIGAIFVVIMFIVIAARGYKIARYSPDTFSSFIAVGLTSMILIEAFVNIGVVTDTLPVTGVTLPFLSYGGSSILFKMAAVGIMMNISSGIGWRNERE